MRRSTIPLIAAFLTAPLFAQDFSKVEIKPTLVAGSVYMLTGAGGNIGVSVGEDGIVVVDDQYAPLAPKITAALKSITDKPVRFVLNTHYHGDHTGGNEAFGAMAPLVAHENVRKRLASGMETPTRKVPPAPKGALPVVTFDHTLTIHLNGEDIRALHLPHGHTDGDAVIYFPKSNVVHVGDLFFNGFFPVIDVDAGGGVKGMIANVKKVLATLPKDAKLIAGHGPLGDAAALGAFVKMLEETSAIVAAGLEAGKTADQMKSEKVLAAWDSWGKGFMSNDRFIDTLVRDLSRADKVTVKIVR
ncbi:MAG: MBL fold metallo-hydrolase [Thermoanaerobaculia bacterium]